MGENAQAERMAGEALAIFRELDDRPRIMWVLHHLANVELERNHLAEAQAAGEECLAIASAAGNVQFIGEALFFLGDIALTQHDLPHAATLFEKVLSYEPGSNVVLNLLGTLACYQGDYERATTLCRDALASFQREGWKHGIATTLHSQGDIALFCGDVVQAEAWFGESLSLFSKNGNKQRATWCLIGLAATAAIDGRALRAVTLWSAAHAIRSSIGAPRPALRHDDYRVRVDAAHNQLDAQVLASAEAAGRALSFDQVVEYALQGSEADEPSVR